MLNALALAIKDHPIFRDPEVSIRHNPEFGIATKIMRCQMVDPDSLGIPSCRAPDNVGSHSKCQFIPVFPNPPEDLAFSHS
jgi:hypothetical protein